MLKINISKSYFINFILFDNSLGILRINDSHVIF